MHIIRLALRISYSNQRTPTPAQSTIQRLVPCLFEMAVGESPVELRVVFKFCRLTDINGPMSNRTN